MIHISRPVTAIGILWHIACPVVFKHPIYIYMYLAIISTNILSFSVDVVTSVGDARCLSSLADPNECRFLDARLEILMSAKQNAATNVLANVWMTMFGLAKRLWRFGIYGKCQM